MKYIRVFLILGLVMQCTAKQKVEQKEVELQNIYNHNLIIYYDREIGKEYLLKYHLISLFAMRLGIFNKSKEYCQ